MRNNFRLQIDLCSAARTHDLDSLSRLLEEGGDPNWFSYPHDHKTAMQEATSEGFIAGMGKLVEAGAKINHGSVRSITPLMSAASRGQLQAGLWLLDRGARPDMKNDDGRTALAMALVHGHTDFADMLLNQCPQVCQQLPEAAGQSIAKGDPTVARWLLNHRISPDITTEEGRPWIVSIQDRRMRHQEEIQDLLLSVGADVNAQDHDGLTALHRALVNGRDASAVKLILAGANPDVPSKYGYVVRQKLVSEQRDDLVGLIESIEAAQRARAAIGTMATTPVCPL